MAHCVHVLALVKDGERFIFLYDEASVDELLRTFGRYAANPDLVFSWYDAAVMSQKVRRIRNARKSREGVENTRLP